MREFAVSVCLGLLVALGSCKAQVDMVPSTQLVNEAQHERFTLGKSRTYLSVAAGQTLRLLYQGTEPAAGQAKWTLSDPTIGAPDAAGHFQARQVGVTHGTLELNGQRFQITIAVTEGHTLADLSLRDSQIVLPGSLPTRSSGPLFAAETGKPQVAIPTLVPQEIREHISARVFLPQANDVFLAGAVVPIQFELGSLPPALLNENPTREFVLVIKDSSQQEVAKLPFQGLTATLQWQSVKQAGSYTLFLRPAQTDSATFDRRLTDFRLSIDNPRANNLTPIVEAIAANPDPVSGPLFPARLKLQARDPDGNPLAFSWSASGGTFDDSLSPTPLWTAPDQGGTFQLTVQVSDGAAIVTKTLQLRVLTGDDSVTGLVKVVL